MKKFTFIFITVSIVICMLTGCSGSNYKKATSMYEEGNYQEAEAIFTELGDYEDSAEMVIKCKYGQAEEYFNSGDYESAAAVYETISDYSDSADKLASAEKEIMLSKYGDVVELLKADSRFYNGGSDKTINQISFTDDTAVISQAKLTGNDIAANGSSEYYYSIDDNNITLSGDDDTEIIIPYKVENDSLVLGSGEYLTTAQVDADLQGYWKYSYSQYILGLLCTGEHNIYLNNGNYTAESASVGRDLPAGDYYFSSDSGIYSIKLGKIDCHKNDGTSGGWLFNIIDGKAVVFYYDSICSRTDSLPGQYGYSF